MVGVAAGGVTAVALELAFPRSVADGTRTGAETRLQQEALKAIRGRGDANLSPLERQLKSALTEAHQAFPGQKFQVVQGFDHQGQTVLALRRGETTIPLMMGASVIFNPTISVPESGTRVSSTAKVRDERLEQIRDAQLERHAREDQARRQRQVTASWSGSAKADLLRAYGSMKGQFEMATPPTIRLKGVDTNQNGRSDRFSVESAEAAIARSYDSAAQHSFKFNRDAAPNGNRMVAFRHPEGPLAPVLVYTGTRAEIARLARDGVVSAQELARAGLGAASLRPGSAKAAQPSPPPDLRTTVTAPRPTPTSTPSTTLQNPGAKLGVGSGRELLLRPQKNIPLPGGSCTSTSPFTVRGFPNGQNAADDSCKTDTLPISPGQAHSTTPSQSTGGVRPRPLHESPQRAGEAQPFQGPTASASAVGGEAVATSDRPSQASDRASSGKSSRQFAQQGTNPSSKRSSSNEERFARLEGQVGSQTAEELLGLTEQAFRSGGGLLELCELWKAANIQHRLTPQTALTLTAIVLDLPEKVIAVHDLDHLAVGLNTSSFSEALLGHLGSHPLANLSTEDAIGKAVLNKGPLPRRLIREKFAPLFSTYNASAEVDSRAPWPSATDPDALKAFAKRAALAATLSLGGLDLQGVSTVSVKPEALTGLDGLDLVNTYPKVYDVILSELSKISEKPAWLRRFW
jgi:hypothetical protein